MPEHARKHAWSDPRHDAAPKPAWRAMTAGFAKDGKTHCKRRQNARQKRLFCRLKDGLLQNSRQRASSTPAASGFPEADKAVENKIENDVDKHVDEENECVGHNLKQRQIERDVSHGQTDYARQRTVL